MQNGERAKTPVAETSVSQSPNQEERTSEAFVALATRDEPRIPSTCGSVVPLTRRSYRTPTLKATSARPQSANHNGSEDSKGPSNDLATPPMARTNVVTAANFMVIRSNFGTADHQSNAYAICAERSNEGICAFFAYRAHSRICKSSSRVILICRTRGGARQTRSLVDAH
jgi:hypothetical protein